MGKWLNLALVTALVAWLAGPLYRQLTVLGVFREKLSKDRAYTEGTNLFTIEDTMQCEDLHYYPLAGQLFTACEDSMEPRYEWFPPMTNFKKPATATATIHVIDPETMKSTRLTHENFSGPFVSHGIDVIEDPKDPKSIYIFAVNHLPHPAYHPDQRPNQDENWEGPKAHSQVELFHHVLGSSSVRHVRSIRHPLIRTPNDVHAESPTSFFVTNDHKYREGLLRLVEDLVPQAKWSDTAHITILDTEENATESYSDPEQNVEGTIAMTGLYNNNGLGRGRDKDEILISSAASGLIWRAEPILSESGNGETKISILEEFRMDSTLDNPSYFTDPHATAEDDASGYVFGGMRKAIDFVLKDPTDPTAEDGAIVWYLRRSSSNPNEWEKRLLFEDDGTFVRSASTAVLVPLSEKSTGNTKQAWLFVTGVYGKSIIAVKVDL